MSIIKPDNLYYMLAYALGIKPETYRKQGSEPFSNHINVLGRILSYSMSRVIKKGFIKGYSEHAECTSAPRGHIDLKESVYHDTMAHGKLSCVYQEYDEYTYDNGFIASVIEIMVSSQDLNSEIRNDLEVVGKAISHVQKVVLDRNVVSRIEYKGRDKDYNTALQICSLFVSDMILNTDGNGKNISSFISEDRECVLFEKFVRGFFAIECSDIFIRQRRMEWCLTDNSGKGSLPDMEVDITLKRHNRTLILDTKYYSKSMSERWDRKTYHSNNLYQICNYVENVKYGTDGIVSGMLLYAKTDEDMPQESHEIRGNLYHLRSLDLSGKWEAIESQLRSIANLI